MQTGDDQQRGISIVSFDGGGPGVISELVMMEEFMERMAYDTDIEGNEPNLTECWDLMGGVGFGGLAALLLGRLCMTAQEAMDELITIGKAIFPKEPQEKSPEENTRGLRTAVEDMLRRNGHFADLKLRESAPTRCKVVVFAAPAAITNHCQAFRTYRHRGRGLECTFVEAACAILAAPETFAPVAIGPPSRSQEFVGIPHGYFNPTREVFKEAQRIYGDEKLVSLFLSLGSGQQSSTSSSETRLTRITYDYGIVEKDLSHQLGGAAAYLRLNVDKGLEDTGSMQWSNVGPIISHTQLYLQMATITDFIDEAVHRVLGATGSITLGQLVGTNSSANIRFDSQKLEDLLERRFKPMHDVLEVIADKITLVDAIGTRIPIPLHWCCSYEMLTSIIRLHFEYYRPPGTELVRKGYYQLISGTQMEEVEPSKWISLAAPGLTVEMSMVRHNRGKRDMACPKCGMSCPKCGRIANEKINDSWAICPPCKAHFRMTDETEPENDLISPAAYNENSTKDKVAGDEEDVTKYLARNTVDEWERFRLITVVNLLRARVTKPKAAEPLLPPLPQPAHPPNLPSWASWKPNPIYHPQPRAVAPARSPFPKPDPLAVLPSWASWKPNPVYHPQPRAAASTPPPDRFELSTPPPPQAS